MKNIFKKSFLVLVGCLLATSSWATDVTFTMTEIFDGNNQSATVTAPIDATITTNASKSNAKDGKLGSDGHYFQVILTSKTFSGVSINGYINTTDKSKNWGINIIG